MAKAAVRKGDDVIVISGGARGGRGKIVEVDPKKSRVKVEKQAMIKKHVRPSQKHPRGGIVEREGWIHISNVQIWDGQANKGVRTRIEQRADGTRVRRSTKSAEVFDTE